MKCSPGKGYNHLNPYGEAMAIKHQEEDQKDPFFEITTEYLMRVLWRIAKETPYPDDLMILALLMLPDLEWRLLDIAIYLYQVDNGLPIKDTSLLFPIVQDRPMIVKTVIALATIKHSESLRKNPKFQHLKGAAFQAKVNKRREIVENCSFKQYISTR